MVMIRLAGVRAENCRPARSASADCADGGILLNRSVESNRQSVSAASAVLRAEGTANALELVRKGGVIDGFLPDFGAIIGTPIELPSGFQAPTT